VDPSEVDDDLVREGTEILPRSPVGGQPRTALPELSRLPPGRTPEGPQGTQLEPFAVRYAWSWGLARWWERSEAEGGVGIGGRAAPALEPKGAAHPQAGPHPYHEITDALAGLRMSTPSPDRHPWPGTAVDIEVVACQRMGPPRAKN
jgi:hypothetical protein